MSYWVKANTVSPCSPLRSNEHQVFEAVQTEICKSSSISQGYELTVWPAALCRGEILLSRSSCSRWMLIGRGAAVAPNLPRAKGPARASWPPAPAREARSSALFTEPNGSLVALLAILVMSRASLLKITSECLSTLSPHTDVIRDGELTGSNGLLLVRRRAWAGPEEPVNSKCCGMWGEARGSDWDASQFELIAWERRGAAVFGSGTVIEFKPCSLWVDMSRLRGSGRLKGTALGGSITAELSLSRSTSSWTPELDRSDTGGYTQSRMTLGPLISSLDTLGGSLIFLGTGLSHGSSAWSMYTPEAAEEGWARLEEVGLKRDANGWRDEPPAGDETAGCCWSPIGGRCVGEAWPIWGRTRNIRWCRAEPSKLLQGRGPTGGLTFNLAVFLGWKRHKKTITCISCTIRHIDRKDMADVIRSGRCTRQNGCSRAGFAYQQTLQQEPRKAPLSKIGINWRS